MSGPAIDVLPPWLATLASGFVCVVLGAAVASWALKRNVANKATVREIIIYPIKSCAGTSMPSARVTPRGLENDRLFLITDKEGRMQTQRVLPKMCRVRPSFNESGDLVISLPRQEELAIRKDEFQRGKKVSVSVWRSDCGAIDQGDEVAEALVAFLGKPGLRLVRMMDGFVRGVEKGFVVRDGVHQVSFADGYPFLLTNFSSLQLLREKSGLFNLHMHRFRPNIVIRGTALPPFDEDTWSVVRIGRTKFEVAKMCSRCQIPRIDPWTGEMDINNEPTKTLKEFRKFGSEVMFGQNAVALNFRQDVTVGDCVTILSRRRRPTTRYSSKVSAR
jgi:uncharacterized protein